jgi:hypothetical protein
MVAAHFHPFNSAKPAGGSVVEFDGGLRLRTYSPKDRLDNNLGKVAGGLFAISKSSVAKTKFAPYLYPILTRQDDNRPIVYWAEDATLDVALTHEGLTNGYLEMPNLTPAIHLPELDEEYTQWKLKAREEPPTEEFKPSNR